MRPVNNTDPEFLMVVSGGRLENIPEANITYVKVSDRPFPGATKVAA